MANATSKDCRGYHNHSSPTPAYPELFAVVGAKVPDLRGLFLRGHGSRTSTHYGTVTHGSGSLGQLQGDAIREISGSFLAQARSGTASGAFSEITNIVGGIRNDTSPDDRLINLGFAVSRVVPTAVENRPVNMAVRYLIRARP